MEFPNSRLKTIPMSGGIFEIFQKSLEFERSGKKIIHMEMGRPDFDSPQNAKKALIESLNDGFVHYTSSFGVDELRIAIAEKAQRDRGIIADPFKEIMVTAGACEALFTIFLSLLEPEDEILIPCPYFPAYVEQAIISGVKLIPVPLKFEKGFRLDAKDIEERITEKTKMLLINTPHNPTGAVLKIEDLQKIAEISKKYGLLVISDECYDEFVFEGKHISISTLPGMRDRTIIINSTSKTYSMTGWRIGYAIGPSEIMKYLNKTHQNMSTCATSFVQVGAAEAFRNGREFIDYMVKEFKRRRDLIISFLDDMEGIKHVKPNGAFYVFPNIVDLNMSSTQFCNYILNEAGVAIVPGESFGEYGSGFVRIAYACSYAKIEEAMYNIKRAIDKLKR